MFAVRSTAFTLAKGTSCQRLHTTSLLRGLRAPLFPGQDRKLTAHRRLAVSAMAGGNGTGKGKNVLGGELQCCCTDPMTGYGRDGYCKVSGGDFGVHAVCAVVSEEFLEFTKSRGNDLSTPHPPSFPGLKPGNRWCLCASRWKEAHEAGVGPKVVLESTDEKALEYIELDVLKKYAA